MENAFEKVVTAKKEHTKEQFLRAALIEVVSKSEAMLDIVNINFSEVQEDFRDVMVYSAHVELDYSASIGYYKQEACLTTKSQYVYEGDWYEYKGIQRRADSSGWRTVDAIGEKTVTDWQAYSGHIGGDSVQVTPNCNDADYDKMLGKNFSNIIIEINNKNLMDEGEAVVVREAFTRVQKLCVHDVESRINFPGDTYKNLKTYPSITTKNLMCWKLPFYKTEYTYQGETYETSAFACGGLKVEAQCPPKGSVNIPKIAKKDTIIYFILMIVGWLIFVALSIIGIRCIAANAIYGIDVIYSNWIWNIVALGVAITLHIIRNRKYIAKLKELQRDTIVQKLQALDNVLIKKGYKKLTDEEKKLFNNEDEAIAFLRQNKPAGVIRFAIVGAVITGLIVLYYYYTFVYMFNAI